MSLKWIFGGKDDAVSVYRRELLAQQEIAALRKAQGLPEKLPQNGADGASDTPPAARNFSL